MICGPRGDEWDRQFSYDLLSAYKMILNTLANNETKKSLVRLFVLSFGSEYVVCHVKWLLKGAFPHKDSMRPGWKREVFLSEALFYNYNCGTAEKSDFELR